MTTEDPNARLERLLRGESLPPPPPDLAGRLRNQIPSRFAERPAAGTDPKSGWSRALDGSPWAIAASLILLVNAAYFGTRFLINDFDPSRQKSVVVGPQASAKDSSPEDFPEAAPLLSSKSVAEAPPSAPAAATSRTSQDLFRDKSEKDRASRDDEAAVAGNRVADAALNASAEPPPAKLDKIAATLEAAQVGRMAEREARLEPAPQSEAVAKPVAPFAVIVPPPPAAEERQMKRRKNLQAGGRFQWTGGRELIDTSRQRFSSFGLEVGETSYVTVRRMLAAGRMPSPETILTEEILNHFALEDAAPERGDFSLHAEGTAAPFLSGERRRLVRFGIKARELATGDAVTGPLVARDAAVLVDFNPAVVAGFRLLGYDWPPSGGGPVEIPAGFAVSAVYEIELQAGTFEKGQRVASMRFRYDSALSSQKKVLGHELRQNAIAESWKEASLSMQVAALAAETAERMRGAPTPRPAELLDLARRLRLEGAKQPTITELIEMIEDLVRAGG